MRANLALLLLSILSGCAAPPDRSDAAVRQGLPSASDANHDIIAESRALWMRENRMTDSVFDGAYRYVVKDRGAGVCIEWYLYNGDIGGDGIYCFDKATRELRFQRLGE